MRSLLSIAALVLVASACASRSGTGASPAAAERVARGPANHLTAAEIEAASPDYQTAYDLVMKLRPSMTRVRASGSARGAAPVAVYSGGMRLGDISRLQQVPRHTVRDIRYYSPTEATQRFGSGHTSGAIEVNLKP